MDNGASSCRRFSPGDNCALDEILQEYRIPLILFLDLLIRPKRYDGRASLKTYLFMRGRSRALDYLRRRKFLSPDPLPENYPSWQDLEAEYLVNEEKLALHRALQALPKDMQQALHLIYFEDLSYAQTAAVMKKTKKQVDNLLYRGKERLRTILKKDGMEI